MRFINKHRVHSDIMACRQRGTDSISIAFTTFSSDIKGPIKVPVKLAVRAAVEVLSALACPQCCCLCLNLTLLTLVTRTPY